MAAIAYFYLSPVNVLPDRGETEEQDFLLLFPLEFVRHIIPAGSCLEYLHCLGDCPYIRLNSRLN